MPEYLSLPLPTLRRLPRYLEFLKAREAEGESWLSSETIGRELGLTAIQVRKDLALTGAPASPKRGFRVEETALRIGDLLGANNLTDVFLIGAGPRGRAACEDDSLERRGFKIVAVFDPSPELEAVCGFKVLPLAKLPGLAKRMGVHLALLAVKESVYPGCLRLAAEGGIRGLVNLSGESIEAIEGLTMIHEDLGFQLASISREIEKTVKKAQMGKNSI